VGWQSGSSRQYPKDAEHFPGAKPCELIFQEIDMAEGVVSEPFLPTFDKVRKGGFATLQYSGNAGKVPRKTQGRQRWFGGPAWCQSNNFDELGTRKDKAHSQPLEKNFRADARNQRAALPGWQNLGVILAVFPYSRH
jgi:hypothetical protein